MDFKNKIALVTDASVEIGRAIAIKLAQNGAKVGLFDINYEKLESVKKRLKSTQNWNKCRKCKSNLFPCK